ncbi:unnamed protein product [Lampetra fluviatilis]
MREGVNMGWMVPAGCLRCAHSPELGRLLVKLGESGWSSQPPPSCCGIHERCGPYDHTMTDDFAPARECCSRLLRYPASRSLLCFSRRP